MKLPHHIDLGCLLSWDLYLSRFKDRMRPEVVEALDRFAEIDGIDEDEAQRLFKRFDGLNTYERHLLALASTNQRLIKMLVEVMLPNCQCVDNRHPNTYDEAVIQVFAPLLAMRLEQADAVAERVRQEEKRARDGEYAEYLRRRELEKTWWVRMGRCLRILPGKLFEES